MSIGIGTTAQLSNQTGISESTASVQRALGISSSTSQSKTKKIIQNLEDDIASKLIQKEQVNDLLLLLDLDLDMYDELITNVDREIVTNIDKNLPNLIEEINVAITTVQDAYRARITNGCKNDLHWVPISSQSVTSKSSSYTCTTYQVQKIAADYRSINYYGLKYYKRPKDRDYGASAVKELPSASVGIGSTYMIVYDPTLTSNGFSILSGIQTNDTITDSIENPTIFSIGSLPEVVGFGSTSLLGIRQTFGGSISTGSTILAYTGFNTTLGITTGDKIWRTGITSTDSLVVGFGTTTVSITGIDTVGLTTTFDIDTNTIILSKPSIGSTEQSIFNVGIYTSYPTIFISTTSLSGTANDNFLVLRSTGVDEIFDPTTNGENPVEVGLIKNENKIGYGHTIILINNGDPDVVRTYIEDVDPQPAVGASLASYYIGNTSWPVINTPIMSGGGHGSPVVTGYTSDYASEGDVVTIVIDSYYGGSAGIGYVGVSTLNPSGSVCSASNSAILSTENSLESIKAKNIPIINDLIKKTEVLRSIRDRKQTTAWAYRRGRGSINNDIIELRANRDKLLATDLSKYE